MVTRLPDPPLFPAFVAQCTVRFDEAAPRETQFPGIALPAALTRAVPKRQLEFAAGRHCAGEALRRCSPDDADAVIGSGRSREPLWPAGIVGAITHTHEYASVAVARTRNARGIGLDAERWMDDDLASRISSHIAGHAEIGTTAQVTGWSVARALTLIFSAKETLFKCLFHEVQRYFDFRDAAVISIDPGRGELALELLAALSPRLAARTRFTARFDHDDRLVRTGMVELAP
jgi:enterobactin synthetase component D